MKELYLSEVDRLQAEALAKGDSPEIALLYAQCNAPVTALWRLLEKPVIADKKTVAEVKYPM